MKNDYDSDLGTARSSLELRDLLIRQREPIGEEKVDKYELITDNESMIALCSYDSLMQPD